MGTAAPAGPSAVVVNLGCRVNRVESDWMESAFLEAGFRIAPESEADVVAINTCAVTGEAQAKTRKAVRHAAGLERHPLVAVTGCVANLFPAELEALGDNVRVVPAKSGLVAEVVRILGETDVPGCALCGAVETDRSRAPKTGRAKRGVKVQDGCDNRCTYCIVWRARGASRSEPLPRVLDQVGRVLSEGAREVDLTGINLGRYAATDAQGRAVRFAGMLREVCALARAAGAQVRASSIEPPEATAEVARAFAENADVACAHLHLPLQSGCSATLGRMGRTYTADEFARNVEVLRHELPKLALSTDVIVGFPGETDAEFEESLGFCRDMRFSKIHVFRFSARPETPAATMPGQVDPETAAARSERMRALADEMRARDARDRLGSVERVLVERADAGGRLWGTTASFHRARLEGFGHVCAPELVEARLVSCKAAGGGPVVVARPV